MEERGSCSTGCAGSVAEVGSASGLCPGDGSARYQLVDLSPASHGIEQNGKLSARNYF